MTEYIQDFTESVSESVSESVNEGLNSFLTTVEKQFTERPMEFYLLLLPVAAVPLVTRMLFGSSFLAVYFDVVVISVYTNVVIEATDIKIN